MMTPAPTFRGRLWRWTKRLSLVTTVVVIATIGAAAFGIPALSRTKWARSRVEKILTRSLGTPVQLGDMTWSWKSGLLLQDVSTRDEGGSSFRTEQIRLRPRLVALAEGTLRIKASIDNADFQLAETGPSWRLPKLPKNGVRIDRLDLLNTTIDIRNGDEHVRVEGLTLHGAGRVKDRVLRLDLSTLSGRCDDVMFAGQGTLRLSREGLSGRIGMNEAAAKEPESLQKVFRALHLSPAPAPVLSDPF
jgi:autotransporter translocation and assembly factor TamB